ncbi:MAG TPA: Uma2 family endonuclease [Gemmatimonadota bacterium]|nr:Uma2 family endonuclease [Gemmatimonadota bacterium]
MTGVETLMTVDEFERLPDDEWRTELVRGRVVREPPATLDQGWLASRVSFVLTDFVNRHGLGETFLATGFVLFEEPPTVRAPHVAFVSRSRLPSREESVHFGRMAPDLAVEIVSPSSTATEILDRAVDYIDSGTPLVWVVEPSRRSVTVYHSRNEIRLLQEGDALDGYDVLPGFSVPVAELFARSTTG